MPPTLPSCAEEIGATASSSSDSGSSWSSGSSEGEEGEEEEEDREGQEEDEEEEEGSGRSPTASSLPSGAEAKAQPNGSAKASRDERSRRRRNRQRGSISSSGSESDDEASSASGGKAGGGTARRRAARTSSGEGATGGGGSAAEQQQQGEHGEQHGEQQQQQHSGEVDEAQRARRERAAAAYQEAVERQAALLDMVQQVGAEDCSRAAVLLAWLHASATSLGPGMHCRTSPHPPTCLAPGCPRILQLELPSNPLDALIDQLGGPSKVGRTAPQLSRLCCLPAWLRGARPSRSHHAAPRSAATAPPV